VAALLLWLRTPYRCVSAPGAQRLRECAHLANFSRTLGFPYYPRYVHHVFGSARTWQISQELLVFHIIRVTCTMSSGVRAPGKFFKNSWFSVLSALRTPCLRECAHRANFSRTLGFQYFPRYVHHVFGSVRTGYVILRTDGFHKLLDRCSVAPRPSPYPQ